MSNLPVPIGAVGVPAPLAFADALAAGLDLGAEALSPATHRAYKADWADFAAWCEAAGRVPLPAEIETAIAYLGALAERGLAVSTINRRAAAITFGHRFVDQDTPFASGKVRAVLSGIRRRYGRPPCKKQALTIELLQKALRKVAGDLPGLRDRAMLLTAFATAMRGSELVAIRVEDLAVHPRGLIVTIPRSKTDQEGCGQRVSIPTGRLKVPGAIAVWREAAGISAGPLFRGVDRGRVSSDALSFRQFVRVIKARCEAIGLDPAAFAGHSTRRGFATTADERGADLTDIARQLRHAKLDTTRGYIEDGELFRDHAGKGFV